MNISGPIIARIRRRRGWTQDELRRRCRVAGLRLSRPVIAKIETKSRSVSDVELVSLARALGVRVTRLLVSPRRKPANGS